MSFKFLCLKNWHVDDTLSSLVCRYPDARKLHEKYIAQNRWEDYRFCLLSNMMEPKTSAQEKLRREYMAKLNQMKQARNKKVSSSRANNLFSNVQKNKASCVRFI